MARNWRETVGKSGLLGFIAGYLVALLQHKAKSTARKERLRKVVRLFVHSTLNNATRTGDEDASGEG